MTLGVSYSCFGFFPLAGFSYLCILNLSTETIKVSAEFAFLFPRLEISLPVVLAWVSKPEVWLFKGSPQKCKIFSLYEFFSTVNITKIV